LLRHEILGFFDQLDQSWKQCGLIHLEVDSFEAGETNDVLTDSDLKIHSLLFSYTFLKLSDALDSDPEPVHFLKVNHNKGNGVIDITTISFVLVSFDWEFGLTDFEEVIPEE